MQLQLPIFPEKTKMINSSLGLFRKDDFVYYLHNGSPVYCHSKDDLNTYRYTLANIVNNKLSSIIELSTALGVNRKNIERYVKTLKTKGTEYFFNRVETRGKSNKLTAEKLKQAQDYLDNNYSQQGTGKILGVSESAIRYHIKEGNLKKTPIQLQK